MNKLLPLLLLTLLLGACADGGRPRPATAAASNAATTTATEQVLQPAVAVHPAHAPHWLRTELYFGTGPANAPHEGVSEAQWREFLDREVTPRFRGGLSVIDLYGQWQGPTQKVPERLRSKLLVLLHEDSPQTREDIEAIRHAWKQQTGDESVLRVTQPAGVSF